MTVTSHRRRAQWVLFPVLLVGVGLLLTACGGSRSAEQSASAQSPSVDVAAPLQGDLQVYAAVSLKNPFDQALADFAAEHPLVTVLPPVYDGSHTLATQITEGAPADVFASADQKNMASLVEAGMNEGEPIVFATNRITGVVSAGNPLGLPSLSAFADPKIRVVTCSPEVPCGAAATKVLEGAGIRVNPISEEPNVAAVGAKVASGEADAGFVYLTDVQASGGALVPIDTPVEAGAINQYPVVTVSGAKNPVVAAAFTDYLLSERGRQTLKDHGFGIP